MFFCVLAAIVGATDRYYYIMADEVVWNYAPSYPHNPLTNEDFDEDAKVFLASEAEGGYIGRKYTKALYIEYTDDTFSSRKVRPEAEEHLGFLGPIIRAEVGDTIYITFRNNGTNPYTMHPHGLSYKNNAYAEGTNGVVPGQTYIYTWHAREESGPVPGSGMSSMNWWYHSHIDPTSETSAGLIGPIVVCAKGMCDADGKPTDVDEEVFTIFMVMDENASILHAMNVQRYLSLMTAEGDDYEESNLMHAMNGYLYGNLGTDPGIEITKGNLVRWYLLAVGNEVDLHTAHWHGNTVVSSDGLRSDVERLLPGAVITVDMIPDMVGTWLWHCHVADHVGAGMMGYYTVTDCGDHCHAGSDKRSFPRLGAAGFVINNSGDQWAEIISYAAFAISVIALVGCMLLYCRQRKNGKTVTVI